MTITTWPLNERPREKLILHGSATLSDAELLAIFLRVGVKGKTAVDLARTALHNTGGLRSLIDADVTTFCQMPGLSKTKYAQLQAALEITKRYLQASLKQGNIIHDIATTKDYLSIHLSRYQHEVFGCMFLDGQHRMISFDILFRGTLHSSAVYPREIVKHALEHNASAVILVHNHPSGGAQPSQADQSTTQLIRKALALVDINVLDHFIVAGDQVVSFVELGLL